MSSEIAQKNIAKQSGKHFAEKPDKRDITRRWEIALTWTGSFVCTGCTQSTLSCKQQHSADS